MKGARHWESKKGSMTYGFTPYERGATLCVSHGWSAAAERFFVRVEFNPSKMMPLTAAFFLGDLNHFLPFGYQTLYRAGNYSRLEICIDVDGVCRDDHVYFDTKLRKIDDAFEDKGTLYLGSRLGRRYLCIYDKGKQVLETTGEVLGCERLRIEARVLHSNTSMPELGNVRNPFLTLRVVQTARLLAIKWNRWVSQFRERVFDEGMQPQMAYAMCTDKSRLLKGLEAATPSWYDPATIWSQFPSIAGSMEPTAMEAFAHQIYGADLSGAYQTVGV